MLCANSRILRISGIFSEREETTHFTVIGYFDGCSFNSGIFAKGLSIDCFVRKIIKWLRQLIFKAGDNNGFHALSKLFL